MENVPIRFLDKVWIQKFLFPTQSAKEGKQRLVVF